MKNISLKLLICLFTLSIISCSKDDDNETQTEKSTAKEITAFAFLASDNDALSEDVKATIDKKEKTIRAEVPFGTDVKDLKPTITLSAMASVKPRSNTTADFSMPVIYTVTAEDGTIAKYTVTLTIGKSDAKVITSFKLLAKDNNDIWRNVEADVDDDKMTITLKLVEGSNVTMLIPQIEISEGATIDPKENVVTDFSQKVAYKLTAEDGSTAIYEVNINMIPLTERIVLEMIYYSNSDNSLNSLDWNLKDVDISNWEGVTLENDKVTALNLESKGISTLPPSIDFLTNLKALNIASNSLADLPMELWNITSLETLDLRDLSLTSIPVEIASLIKLKELHVSFNALTNLPIEIGNLTNLEVLRARVNSLTTLPVEIGNLTNLKILDVFRNTLSSLPSEIDNLISLETLSLTENSLTGLPSGVGNLTNLNILSVGDNLLTEIGAEIGNLKNLTFLRLSNNSLTSLPSEIGSLVILETFYVQGNSLTNLPMEIGNLTNLESLNIAENQITIIPKEICDLNLDAEKFTRDDTAICEE